MSKYFVYLVSMDNLATPFVCIASGYLQQKFGPRKILLVACLPYFGGWTLSSMAKEVWAIYLSRLLVGVNLDRCYIML